MNRQVLPRQRPLTAAPGAAGPRPPAPPPAAGPSGRAPGAVRRRPALVVLVAAATVVLGGLTWALVRSPAELPQDQASVLVRPRASASATPSVPSPSGPAASPRTATGTATGTEGTPVRDPFSGAAPATDPGPVRTTPVATTSPASSPPASLTASPTTVPTTLPTTAPTAAPTGAPATVTVTRTATATRTATPTATPTVTMTAPGSAVYVGFYAWNKERASFRVNARTYSMRVGATFGPRLTFTAVVPGTPRCARLQHGDDRFTLCPGQVVRLP